jgi:hypothetical protein
LFVRSKAEASAEVDEIIQNPAIHQVEINRKDPIWNLKVMVSCLVGSDFVKVLSMKHHPFIKNIAGFSMIFHH